MALLIDNMVKLIIVSTRIRHWQDFIFQTSVLVSCSHSGRVERKSETCASLDQGYKFLKNMTRGGGEQHAAGQDTDGAKVRM